ncbi:universal stress protein [Corynebacterium sp.]|jgi:nucleotide-binding universal stress UspA family protein|uniref:universal stress protein n=1 Tax=Corynebacterium sp. TaxID=1720 RepID=UPI0025C3E5BA|nr:universal stress protein [Corynebacterium sp.]
MTDTTRRIVTGVDSSQTALNAAGKAAELAEGLGAELHVFSAYSISTADTLQSFKTKDLGLSTSVAYQNLTDGQARAAAHVADAVAGVLREAHPGLTIVSSAQEGTPSEVLVRQARALSADMIVVGNKHVQGFSRILGSVARKVAAEATCDLYIVHTTHR